MSDIFDQRSLYPDTGSIKAHFEGVYQSVFVAFLPFFKIVGSETQGNHYRKSKLMSIEEAMKEDELLRKLNTAIDREIYVYNNKDYPTDRNVFENGRSVSWETIMKGSGLTNRCELNNALLTSIGALKKKYSTPRLALKLDCYTTKKKKWHPVEGTYDMLSKRAIYRVFRLLKKNRIVVNDEIFETSQICEINLITEFKFCELVRGKDYYIYSDDKEILFTIDWDSFFFLIASSQENMKMILKENLFEGFYCDPDTTHHWSLMQG